MPTIKLLQIVLSEIENHEEIPLHLVYMAYSMMHYVDWPSLPPRILALYIWSLGTRIFSALLLSFSLLLFPVDTHTGGCCIWFTYKSVAQKFHSGIPGLPSSSFSQITVPKQCLFALVVKRLLWAHIFISIRCTLVFNEMTSSRQCGLSCLHECRLKRPPSFSRARSVRHASHHDNVLKCRDPVFCQGSRAPSPYCWRGL